MSWGELYLEGLLYLMASCEAGFNRPYTKYKIGLLLSYKELLETNTI